MRAGSVLLFLTLPLLAGCFDEPDPTLAKPTTSTVLPPVPSRAVPTPKLFDPHSPGLNITIGWRVGDGWDYESNGTSREFRTVRVTEEKVVGNRTLYRTVETFGRAGGRAAGSNVNWVDGKEWTLLNVTDSSMSLISYTPPQPLRFYRNQTFSYNETGFDTLTRSVIHHSYFVFSFLEAKREIQPAPCGNVLAARVLHDAFIDEAREPRSITYWVHEDYANPVRYDVEGVGWKLLASRSEGRECGVLQPT